MLQLGNTNMSPNFDTEFEILYLWWLVVDLTLITCVTFSSQ